MTKPIFSCVGLMMLVACSNGASGPSDSGSDASSDASQEAEASVVTCTTPGAACPTGGKCFFAVGDCTATTGVCADDSACAGAKTESVCGCDGTMPVVPQCGPGNTALAKAAYYGPCVADASAD